MTSKVAKPRAAAKSGRVQIRNQKGQKRNQFSPIVLKLREILQAEKWGKKAAHELGAMIFRPLSTCQKILDGKARLNADSIILLLQSERVGAQVHAAIMDDAPHPAWYASVREDIDVFDLAKDVAAQQRRVDMALKARMGQ